MDLVVVSATSAPASASALPAGTSAVPTPISALSPGAAPVSSPAPALSAGAAPVSSSAPEVAFPHAFQSRSVRQKNHSGLDNFAQLRYD